MTRATGETWGVSTLVATTIAKRDVRTPEVSQGCNDSKAHRGAPATAAKIATRNNKQRHDCIRWVGRVRDCGPCVGPTSGVLRVSGGGRGAESMLSTI